jgi:hypothetical protein
MVTTEDDAQPPLVVPMMRNNGRRLGTPAGLAEARERAARALATLPDALRTADQPCPAYSVEISSNLVQPARETDRGVSATLP